MTEEELNKTEFHFVGHLSMEYEHSISYASKDGRLGICKHTIRKKDGNFGRTYIHYRIDSKVYKSRKDFIKALEDFSPNVKPLTT